MQISSNQIAQVNQQIQALLNANNFYGKKLKEAGVSSIQSAEDFENLPFSEEGGLRKNCSNPLFFRNNRASGHYSIYSKRCG